MYTYSEFKKNNALHLKIFTSCVITRGAKNSIICDLERQKYYSFSNKTMDLIEFVNNKTFNELNHELEEKEIFKLYKTLILNDLVFFTEFPNSYPVISNYWNYPGEISNFIIDYNVSSSPLRKDIYDHLDIIGVTALEIRYYFSPSLELLEEELDKSITSIIRSIDLNLKYSKEYDLEFLKNLCNKFQRINQVVLHSSEYKKIEYYKGFIFIFTTEKIKDESHCGIISKYNFNINVEMYTESLNYNSCLNRKLSVDSKGNIKNCPSSKEILGNVKTKTLLEVLNQRDYKKYWAITKDMIDTCKDCEFRYVCTDCRVYLKEENDQFSKPLKCDYDPYTGIWKK